MRLPAKVFGLCAILVIFATFACSPTSRATDTANAQREQDLAALAQGLGITLEEARQRQDMRDAAQGLFDAVYADPTHFAGVFQTAEGGKWRIVVMLPGGVAPTASIQALVPDGIPVEFVQAQYSLDELRNVHGQVVDFWKQIDPTLTAVDGINLDTVSNRIVIEFAGKDYPDLRATFSRVFGPIVSFRVVEPGVDVSCDHLTDFWEESRYNCTEVPASAAPGLRAVISVRISAARSPAS